LHREYLVRSEYMEFFFWLQGYLSVSHDIEGILEEMRKEKYNLVNVIDVESSVREQEYRQLLHKNAMDIYNILVESGYFEKMEV